MSTATRPLRPSRRRAPRFATEASLATSRAVARRSDIFDGRTGEHRIDYRSEGSEGIITTVLASASGQPADPTALAMLLTITSLYLRGHTRRVRRYGQESVAVETSARELALAVLGRADGRAYQRLGLVRHGTPGEGRGAIDRLMATVVTLGSSWLGPKGTQYAVRDAFHLLDWYRWEHAEGRRGRVADRLYIGLSAPIVAELDAKASIVLPRSLVRALPSHGPAGRLGVFVLSHSPMPGGNARRLSVEACMAAVGIPADAAGRAGRQAKYLRRAVLDLAEISPEYVWQIEDGPHGAVVTCEARRPE